MLVVLGLVGLSGFPQDLGDLLLELAQGAVGPIGSVGGHLRPIKCHEAQADQPGRRAQLQRLDQEAGERRLVPNAESGDRHMVGELVAGKDAEREVLAAAPLDLPGGPHPDRVGVQQHTEQRLGLVGGMAVPVGTIGAQEWTEVELVDDVKDEPGQMIGGQPVAQVRGQQERLVAVTAKEVVGPSLFYPFATLVPMYWFLASTRRAIRPSDPPGRGDAGLSVPAWRSIIGPTRR
jgi:hypothetical protein